MFTMIIEVFTDGPAFGQLNMGDCILSANGQPMQNTRVCRYNFFKIDPHFLVTTQGRMQGLEKRGTPKNAPALHPAPWICQMRRL